MDGKQLAANEGRADVGLAPTDFREFLHGLPMSVRIVYTQSDRRVHQYEVLIVDEVVHIEHGKTGWRRTGRRAIATVLSVNPDYAFGAADLVITRAPDA